ncbi:MAG: phospholipid carrier-dependent glycosyltransferase [Patescibacteria group bacterium]|nr:phospholipid carrier-dependent glycosyltransferase [Patescibacteria group bacterium]
MTIAVLGVLVVVGLVLRVVCYTGLGATDSLGYIGAAAQLGQGQFPWENYPAAYASVGLIVPIVPFVMLGGYTSWLPTIFSLMCGVALIPLTYWLARQCETVSTGLWAAFVAASSTLAIGSSMKVLPDTPLALWSSLAIALVVCARGKPSPRAVFLFCLAAGVALGIACTTKLTAVFVFPVLWLAIVPMSGKRLSAIAGGCTGLFLVLLAFLGFWTVVTGDPWDGFRCAFSGTALTDPDAPLPPRHSLWAFPIKMFLVISHDGLFYYFLVPAVLWGLARRRRQLWLPLAWVGIVFACLQFGSSSVSSYRPFPHNARYLMLLLPAGAVIIGSALAHLTTHRPRCAFALACGYATVCCSFAFLQAATAPLDLPAATTAIHYLTEHPPRAVFTDAPFAPIFNFALQDYQGNMPEAEVWLDEHLAIVASPLQDDGSVVIRFDERIIRRQVTAGNYEPIDIDTPYEWLDEHAQKTVIALDHARLRRAALMPIAAVIRRLPLPGALATRLDATMSRHTAPRTIILYFVRPTPRNWQTDRNAIPAPALVPDRSSLLHTNTRAD